MVHFILRTERLTLRQFTMPDAARVQQFARAREVAENTLMIPHLYPDGAAAESRSARAGL